MIKQTRIIVIHVHKQHLEMHFLFFWTTLLYVDNGYSPGGQIFLLIKILSLTTLDRVPPKKPIIEDLL